jgi:uncharacterized protein (DUF1330 family)
MKATKGRALLLAAALTFSCRTSVSTLKEPSMTEPVSDRYYQLVFITVSDAQKFAQYLELLRPVVTPYGGALERMLAPETVYGDAMPKPEIVNIVYYDDERAFEAFKADPEFRKIEHLRAESIHMSVLGGRAIGGVVSETHLAERIYLVEVARYRQGVEGYLRYAEEASAFVGRFGYHTERVLRVETAQGFGFEPTLVRIAYFDAADGFERMQEDPAHERFDKLYADATSDSVWLSARVHPSMLRPLKAG